MGDKRKAPSSRSVREVKDRTHTDTGRRPGPATSPRSSKARGSAFATAGICLGIVAIVGAIYAGVTSHGFVYVDDGEYILDNVHVNRGLSWAGVRWAFTAFHSGNWHPLTWISHMVDAQLFGVTAGAAGGHHLVSVGLHALGATLLFVVLHRMTGHRWSSALVAALFAVHPLRVESVAWASERKDVLSGVFFMFALLAYDAYAKRPGIGSYSRVLMAVTAGLLAKPMLVTIPFVFLLLDVWPLGRWRPKWMTRSVAATGAGSTPVTRAAITPDQTEQSTRGLRRLIVEKLPMLALCLGSGVATLLAQRRGDSVSNLSDLSLEWRLVELPISYATYLWKTFWPSDLAFFYPHHATFARDGIDARLTPAALTGIGIVVTTVAVAWKAMSSPRLLVGWLWFLGMMVPVIGLLQVGTQAWADRYAYLPLIGIYLMIAFGARDQVSRWRPATMRLAVGVACAAIVALAVTARRQVDVWRDTRTLLHHAATVTKNNWLVHNDLGVEISREQRLEEGRRHFEEALRIRPDYAEAHSNLGFSWFFEGRLDEARRACERALEIKPDHPEGHFVMGCVLDRQREFDRAREHFERAIRIRPEYAEAHFRLGLTLQAQGRFEDARRHFEEALRLTPEDLQTQLQLAALLAAMSSSSPHDRVEALALLQRVAGRMQGQGPARLATMAAAWAAVERFDEAVQWQTQAISVAPDTLRASYLASLARYRAELQGRSGTVSEGDPSATIPSGMK